MLFGRRLQPEFEHCLADRRQDAQWTLPEPSVNLDNPINREEGGYFPALTTTAWLQSNQIAEQTWTKLDGQAEWQPPRDFRRVSARKLANVLTGSNIEKLIATQAAPVQVPELELGMLALTGEADFVVRQRDRWNGGEILGYTVQFRQNPGINRVQPGSWVNITDEWTP